MSHEFTLVLTPGEVTDDQVNGLYEAGLDDGTVSTSRGVARIDVTRAADSLESAIRRNRAESDCPPRGDLGILGSRGAETGNTPTRQRGVLRPRSA